MIKSLHLKKIKSITNIMKSILKPNLICQPPFLVIPLLFDYVLPISMLQIGHLTSNRKKIKKIRNLKKNLQFLLLLLIFSRCFSACKFSVSKNQNIHVKSVKKPHISNFLQKLGKIRVKSVYLETFLDPIQNRLSVRSTHLEAAYLEAFMYLKIVLDNSLVCTTLMMMN